MIHEDPKRYGLAYQARDHHGWVRYVDWYASADERDRAYAEHEDGGLRRKAEKVRR